MSRYFEKLTNKVVVITGASSGLGEEIAYAAAAKGATLILCARREDELARVKAKCTALSSAPVFCYFLDIAEPENIETVCTAILTEVGTVDVLVNCAGFGLFEEFLATPMETVEKMFRVNVLGLMYLTQKLAIHMAEKQSGHIVNIASQAGKIATPKSAVYSATKFAVLGFSNALRLELKPVGVHVTTVNPGPIATNFFQIADTAGGYLSSIQWMVIQPETLAKQIVGSFGSSRREINAPFYMEIAGKFYTLFPHIGDLLAGNLFNKK